MIRDMAHVIAVGQGDPVDEKISAAVRGLIAQHRVAPAKVALAVGISRTAFFNKLSTAAPWKAQEVDSLARYFEVSRDSLYEGRAEFRSGGPASLVGAGARSSTDRASDYGSGAAHFRRPGLPRRRRTDRRHDAVVPLYLVRDCPLSQRESA